MPDNGNRRKLSSGVLTGGIRRDIDPTTYDLNQQRQAQSLVSLPRGLERTNAYASAASLSTNYPIFLTEVGTPDGPIESGTIEIINDDGTVTYAGSRTDLYYELEDVGVTFTTAAATQGDFPTTVAVDGVTYNYDAYETFNLRPGDVLVDTTTVLVGSAFAIATVTNPAIAKMTSALIAFIDDTNDNLRAYGWSGTAWSLTGSGLAIGTVTNPALAGLSSTRVAFIDDTNDSLRAYDFNGSTWSLVGSGLSIATVTSPALCALNSTDVVLANDGTNSLQVYRFNGSAWNPVGTPLLLGSMTDPGLCTLDATHIVYSDEESNGLQCYRWDGSSFSKCGAAFRLPTSVRDPAMCALTETDIAYIDETGDAIRRFRFNGYTWREILPTFSTGATTKPALCYLSTTDIAFVDDTGDSLETYRLAGPLSAQGIVEAVRSSGIGGYRVFLTSASTLPVGAIANLTIRYKATPTPDVAKTALWDSTEFNGIALVSALDRPFAQIDIGGYVTAKNRGTAFPWPVDGVANDLLFAITAATIEVFQSFIFIGCTREQFDGHNSTIYPNRVRWSSSFDPLTDWTNTLSFLDLPNANGAIVKLLTHKQFLMAYCETGIFYGSLSGDPALPVTFQELNTDNTGLVGVRAICQAKQIHFFCGRENVYMLDGLAVQPIGDPIVQQTLRACLNASYIQMVYDARKQRILVGFPLADGANIDTVYALSLETQAWTLAFSRSTKILTNAQSSRLQGVFTTNDIYITSLGFPNVYTLLKEQADSAVPASATGVDVIFETGDIGGNDLSQIKEFFGLWVKVAENQAGATRTLAIAFTVALSTDHGVTYIQLPSPLYILPNKQEGYATFKRISNHLRIKLTSSTLVAPYTLVSYTVDVKGMQATESLLTQGVNNPNT